VKWSAFFNANEVHPMKYAGLMLALLIANAATCAVAGAQTVPTLKPGAWELHTHAGAGAGGDALPLSVCFGAMPAAQREAEQANIRSRCSTYDARAVGAEWVVDAVCTARGHSVTKHTVTSLAGDNFREENTGPDGASMISTGKRVGPCRPGQQPDAYK
jgi:hypothetical protein